MSEDKKGILRAMVLATVISLLGIGILGWQYRQIEKQRIPKLQEEIERQKAEVEKKSAELVVERFMSARIKGDAAQTKRYLTENAIRQIESKEFELIKTERYEVLNASIPEEGKTRFAVKVFYKEGGVGDLVELVTLVKILDAYYIDSLEFAG